MNDLPDGKKTKSTAYTGASLEEEARRLIREQSPNCDPVEKLAQLELHERLHAAYEGGHLRKCSLSFYLNTMAKKRRKLLHFMGSSVAKSEWDDPSIDVPSLPIGLTMIPKGWQVLADKGFTPTSRCFPHFNVVLTPTWLVGTGSKRVKNGRYDSRQVSGDRPKCKLRYSCEVAFARVILEETLSDVIRFDVFYGDKEAQTSMPAQF
uniref:Uncharacterized protein n=1 Tax=Grammatophora oceanica TaxID=210454 RepID=A0A7S1V150_9STRA